ncbi:MFS general substrate transporter [Imleria badia]|nr:MFS general substrate transporter [Imleria badia]
MCTARTAAFSSAVFSYAWSIKSAPHLFVFQLSVPSSISPQLLSSVSAGEISSGQDPEKSTIKLAGKYAKYAGEPPDGGLKAWTVIIGTAFTTCAAFGYVNAWGIFQAYYEEVMLPNDSASDIAWIGSVQIGSFLIRNFVACRHASRMIVFSTALAPQMPYFIGSCLLILCTFLIAECKVYWQFFLVQGVGIGLACGMLFGPTLGIVSHWFSKRRGLALGVNAIGSSIGGTVFPIAAQNLIPEVGFKWTMRIFGFIVILLLGIANLTLDRRLPPENVKGGLLNCAALKNPAYAVYCISSVTTFLGLYTGGFSPFFTQIRWLNICSTNARRIVLTYIPISAVQMGVSNDFAFYFIAIANGSSGLGRITAGLLADRFGAINIMTLFTIVAAIMTFVWPFATSKGALIAIAVIYGFSCGTYVSLFSVPAISMGAIGDVGRRTGLFLSFAALGALGGPPISGAINSATGGFEDVGWYAGGMLLLSVCLFLLTRYLHLGKLMGKF